MQDGTGLVMYLGHSSSLEWTEVGLFDTATASSLEGDPTMVVQFGCWNTYYVSPDADTLAHALLLNPDGTKLSLRGLLHYLWDEAELTRWDPRFAGRRSWATVRHHLLQAAEGKVVGARPLRQRLYVPEVFSAERRDEIRARRLAWWQHASGLDGAATGDGRAGGQTLMLLVGEAKAIVPGPCGGRLVVKHVPDQGFALGERLYRGIARRYAAELAVWTAQASLHLVVAATFRADGARACPVEAVALMTVTAQWLPVADREAVVDVERMVRDGRAFRVRAGGDAIGASVSASARGGVVGSREPPRESRRPVGVSQDGAS